eukprot:m.635289 g.635289  ORF g.635289 m.635289 type:complete len:505 (-) comp22582_c0_seq2:379-1893(-)
MTSFLCWTLLMVSARGVQVLGSMGGRRSASAGSASGGGGGSVGSASGSSGGMGKGDVSSMSGSSTSTSLSRVRASTLTTVTLPSSTVTLTSQAPTDSQATAGVLSPSIQALPPVSSTAPTIAPTSESSVSPATASTFTSPSASPTTFITASGGHSGAASGVSGVASAGYGNGMSSSSSVGQPPAPSQLTLAPSAASTTVVTTDPERSTSSVDGSELILDFGGVEQSKGEEQSAGSSGNSAAGAVGGIVFFVAVLLLLLFFVKRRQREQGANDDKLELQEPTSFARPSIVRNAMYIGGGQVAGSSVDGDEYETPHTISDALYLSPVGVAAVGGGSSVAYDLGGSSAESGAGLYDAASGNAAAFYDTATAESFGDEEQYGFGFPDAAAQGGGEQPLYAMGTMNGAIEQPVYDMGTMGGGGACAEDATYDVAGASPSNNAMEDAALYDMAGSGNVAALSSGYLQVGPDVEEGDAVYDIASAEKLDTAMVQRDAHIYDLSVPLRKIDV